MLSIFHFFLNLIEFNYKKKINEILKKNLPTKLNIFFDIGAHKGETSIEMYKNFSIRKSYLFEPVIENFKILENRVKTIKLKNKIELYNFALGEDNKVTVINEVLESSSSTLNNIDENTRYYKRKKKILNLFSNKNKISQKKVEVISSIEFIKKKILEKLILLKLTQKVMSTKY